MGLDQGDYGSLWLAVWFMAGRLVVLGCSAIQVAAFRYANRSVGLEERCCFLLWREGIC